METTECQLAGIPALGAPMNHFVIAKGRDGQNRYPCAQSAFVPVIATNGEPMRRLKPVIS